MFATMKQRILLGVYIFLILSIPVGAYLASQNQTVKSKASEPKTKFPVSSLKSTTSQASQLLTASTPSQIPSSSPSSPTTQATSFGLTLSLKAILEGRPASNQSTKLFVGIVEGILTANPTFLLSFTVNLSTSGSYDNLSLAGLTSGTTYTALLKGNAQIATSSAFVMSPTVTNLNNGEPLTMLTGDLNEDNVINTSDYAIAQKAAGSTSKSSNWNELADFNLDGIVNVFDIGIIGKNLGQVGASGAWTSPIPKNATPSSSIAPTTGGPAGGGPNGAGYWIWVPSI